MVIYDGLSNKFTVDRHSVNGVDPVVQHNVFQFLLFFHQNAYENHLILSSREHFEKALSYKTLPTASACRTSSSLNRVAKLTTRSFSSSSSSLVVVNSLLNDSTRARSKAESANVL